MGFPEITYMMPPRYFFTLEALFSIGFNKFPNAPFSQMIGKESDMKCCIFVDRRCYGNDCVGWIKENCFIDLLLPNDYSDKQSQTEFDWSKYESLKAASHDTLKNSNDQLSLIDELEKLIAKQNN